MQIPFTSARRSASAHEARAALIMALHAAAFLVFLLKPLAGAALLVVGFGLAVGMARPLWVAVVCMGLLWINDPISDFFPKEQYTAWKDVLLLTVIFGWLLRSAIMRRPLLLKHELSTPMALLVGLFLVGCVGSPTVAHAIFGIKNTIFYMAWFFVLPDVVRTRRDARNLVIAIIFGAVCLAIYNLWRVQMPLGVFPVRRDGKFLTGQMMAHWSGSPYMLATAVVLMVGLMHEARGIARVALWICVGVAGAGLLVTTVRAMWLATMIATLAMGFVSRRFTQVVVLGLLLVITGGIVQTTSKVNVSDRLASTLDPKDESRMARTEETHSIMLPWVMSHPMGAGTGVMTARGSGKIWAGDFESLLGGGMIHNTFLQVAIEIGWLGAFIYLMALLSAITAALRAYRNAQDSFLRSLALGLFGTSVAFLVMQFFSNMINVALLSFQIWVLYGLILVVPLLDRGEDPAMPEPPARLPAAPEPVAHGA